VKHLPEAFRHFSQKQKLAILLLLLLVVLTWLALCGVVASLLF
jgi:hypothetical protein